MEKGRVRRWRDNGSAMPVYMQLAEFLRREIISGKLAPGTRLPGRTAMLKIFGISKGTLNRALTQLVESGLLISYPKSGFVVAKSENGGPDWLGYIKRARHKPGIPYSFQLTDIVSLAEQGLPSDFPMFSYIEKPFAEAIKKQADQKNIRQLDKYGFYPLREAISRHLENIKIYVSPEHVLVCPGNVQTLYTFYEALTTGGSTFVMERANLINTISNIHSLGLNMQPVPMDEHGISVLELEKALCRARHPLLHLDPTDHAPTGIVMSLRRKKDIMKLVQKYRVPVMEIEHIREGWYDKPFPPPLKSLDTQGNIIYQGSFIRCMPFDINLSWFVADPYLIEYLSNVHIQHGITVNYFLQVAANEIFRSGAYYEMMDGYRVFLRRRRQYGLELCEKYLKGLCEWDEKLCGFHFWIRIPGLNVKKIYNAGICNYYFPGYFFDRSDTDHVLFCPCALKESQIEHAVRNIAEIAGRR